MKKFKCEKHNIVDFIIKNQLKEFTLEQLVKYINVYTYISHHKNGKISKYLHELSIDGFLKVEYFSHNGRTLAKYTR